MATSMADHKTAISCITLVIVYFLWMDVTLYYKIQGLRLNYATTETPDQGDEYHLFSPFKGISIKMMMMDHVNNYIHTPLAEIFNRVTKFSQTFSFITPDMISFLGLVCAIIAGRFMMCQSLAFHRLAVLMFQFRTWFDALDGIVARHHMGVKIHISLRNTSGHFVDGIADTFGFAALIIGCYIYLRRNYKQRICYLPLINTSRRSDEDSNDKVSFKITKCVAERIPVTAKHVFVIVICFSIQLGLSAVFWNRYIEEYHRLLETPTATQGQAALQNEVLKSSVMWVLIWFWRVANSHSLMQMLLLAIFVNRLWEFLSWIQYIGFVVLFTLAFFTEIHLSDVESYFHRVT